MAHLLGFELQRNNTRYNDNCQEAYIARAPRFLSFPQPFEFARFATLLRPVSGGASFGVQ